MGDATVVATASIGYIGVGTVEFLLDERGEFYFMEMNTRTQVEHPVTEMISSVDLIEEQIRVPMGEKLRMLRGHSIECRINAEDAFKNFSGPWRITAYLPSGGPFVRMDSHVYTDYVVPPSYDSLLGKIGTISSMLMLDFSEQQFFLGSLHPNVVVWCTKLVLFLAMYCIILLFYI